MRSFTYTIKDKTGIHARPAGVLSKLAKNFESDVVIEMGEKKVNAARLMMLMGMGIKCGDTVTVTVTGKDEDEALCAVESFFKENL